MNYILCYILICASVLSAGDQKSCVVQSGTLTRYSPVLIVGATKARTVVADRTATKKSVSFAPQVQAQEEIKNSAGRASTYMPAVENPIVRTVKTVRECVCTHDWVCREGADCALCDKEVAEGEV